MRNLLQDPTKSGTINVKNGLLVCPTCKQKTNQAVPADFEAHNLPVWCKTCKRQFRVNIEFGQCCEVSRCL